jgi:hypothetical protein
MANSREQSQFGRRRSNTAQSSFRAPPPASLSIGDNKILNAWVHDVKDSHSVIFNQTWWPGVAEGDCLRVFSNDADNAETAFLFIVPKDDNCPKPQLQVCFLSSCACELLNELCHKISVPRPIADVFGLRNNGEVTLTKVR